MASEFSLVNEIKYFLVEKPLEQKLHSGWKEGSDRRGTQGTSQVIDSVLSSDLRGSYRIILLWEKLQSCTILICVIFCMYIIFS